MGIPHSRRPVRDRLASPPEDGLGARDALDRNRRRYWVHVCQRLLAVACAALHSHRNRLCCLDGYRQQIRERAEKRCISTARLIRPHLNVSCHRKTGNPSTGTRSRFPVVGKSLPNVSHGRIFSKEILRSKSYGPYSLLLPLSWSKNRVQVETGFGQVVSGT